MIESCPETTETTPEWHHTETQTINEQQKSTTAKKKFDLLVATNAVIWMGYFDVGIVANVLSYSMRDYVISAARIPMP